MFVEYTMVFWHTDTTVEWLQLTNLTVTALVDSHGGDIFKTYVPKVLSVAAVEPKQELVTEQFATLPNKNCNEIKTNKEQR